MVPELNKRMPVYPIRTAARMADVHPRRLRAWERQNGLLSPARTDGGHRRGAVGRKIGCEFSFLPLG